MTMETIPNARGRGYDDLTSQLAETELQSEDGALRRDAVVIVGAGQNTAHMGDSIARLNEQHPVHVLEVSEPQIPVAPERLHFINTPEGRESAEKLFGSGVVHAVYLSVIPRLHVPALKEHLQRVGEDQADFVVVAKPVVQTIKEMKEIDVAKARAEIARSLLPDSQFDPAADSILYVHEHYIEKGAWHTFREQLGSVTERLGRLHSVVIDIEEARTAEQEGRTAAFEGGALEDFGPHVISLGLNVQASINKTGRYTIPDHSQTSVQRFRYDDSDLREGVETGFIVHGNTQITDNEEGDVAHDLQFVWRGGKGLVDRKEVVLEFEHPETHVCTTIRVDLRNNTLDVPDAVKDLFPVTKFDDNGYGYVVEVGLNGGDPRRSFQQWEEARVVTKLGYHLARQGQGDLHTYHTGMSLQELDDISVK